MPIDLFESTPSEGGVDLFSTGGADKKKSEDGDFVRGLKKYVPQMQEMYGAGKTLLGKAIDSPDIMQSGIADMRSAKARTEEIGIKPTDELTGVKGIGDFADWAQHGLGQVAGNLGESLVAAGIGAGIGGMAGNPITAGVGGVGGFIGKNIVKGALKDQAESIAAKYGAKEAEQFVAKGMADDVAKKTIGRAVGQNLGIAGMAGFHGVGETGSRAIEEANYDPSQVDLGHVLPRAAAHTAAEFLGDKIGLAGMLGKGGYRAAGDGIASAAKTIGGNMAIVAGKEIPVELFQSIVERDAAKLALMDADAQKEYINTAAQTALFGIAGVPAGIRAYNNKGAAKPDQTTPDAQPADQFSAAPATAQDKPSVTPDNLFKHATDRLSDIERKASGTPDQTVQGPDGKPMVVPGELPRFLTYEEKAERDFLKANIGNQEALATGYGVSVAAAQPAKLPDTGPMSRAANVGIETGAASIESHPTAQDAEAQFQRLAELELVAEQRRLTPAEFAEADRIQSALDQQGGDPATPAVEPSTKAPEAGDEQAKFMASRNDAQLKNLAGAGHPAATRQAAGAEIARRAGVLESIAAQVTAPAQQSSTSPLQQSATALTLPGGIARAAQPAQAPVAEATDAMRLDGKRAAYAANAATGAPDDVTASVVLKWQEKTNERSEPMNIWRSVSGALGLVPANQKSPFVNGELLGTMHPDKSENIRDAKPVEMATQEKQANDAQVGPVAPAAQGASQAITQLRREVESADPFSERSADAISRLASAVTDDAKSSIASGQMPVYRVTDKLAVTISPSAQNPGKFQVTRYSSDGVLGDSQYNSIDDAIRQEGISHKPRMSQQEADSFLGASVSAESKYQQKLDTSPERVKETGKNEQVQLAASEAKEAEKAANRAKLEKARSKSKRLKLSGNLINDLKVLGVDPGMIDRITRNGISATESINDLGEVAERLRSEGGYIFDDVNHDAAQGLAEFLRRVASGEASPLNAARMEEDIAEREAYLHKNGVNERAGELGLKKVGGKRTLAMVEAEITKIEAERSAMEADQERAAIQAEAVFSEPQDMTEADIMRWLSQDVFGAYEQEDIDRAEEDRANRENARAEANAAAAAEESAQGRAGERAQDGRAEAGAGRPQERARADEGFDLAGQTPAEVRQQESARVAAESEATRLAAQEAADKKAAEKKSLDDAIKARAENPGNFQFGEDAKAAAKPMGGLFDQPAPKPAEPVAQPKAEPAKAQDEDWLNKLFGQAPSADQENKESAESVNAAQEKAGRVDAAIAMLTGEIEANNAAAAELAARKYKANRKQIELKGDGPGRNGSMSISAINESRKRRAIEASLNASSAIKKAIEFISEDADSAFKQVLDMETAVTKQFNEGFFGKSAKLDDKLDMAVGSLIGSGSYSGNGSAGRKLRMAAHAYFAKLEPSTVDAVKQPEFEAWYTAIPAEGLPLTKEQEAGKLSSYEIIPGVVAADAWDAITQTQKTGQIGLYAYVNPAAGGMNGIVRLFPDDQTPPAPWKLLDPQIIRQGAMTREQGIAKLRELLRSAPILGEKQAAKQPETKPAEQEAKPAEKIDDFGAKLGGARKDLEADLRKEWSDDEIAQSTLSKVWPKADVNAIEDAYVAAFAHAARAEIPAKPRVAYKVDRWVQQVKLLRGLTLKVADGKISKEAVNEAMSKNRTLQHFATKVSLLEAIDRANWDRVGEVAEYPDAYRYSNDGKEKIATPMVSVRIDGKVTNYDGKALADVLDKVREDLGEAAPGQKMQFEVRGQPGAYFINKKGDPLYRRLKKFDTSKEALDYRDSNYADLVAAWGSVKDSDNVKETDVRSKDNRPRTGADRRNGKDVTPQQFTDELGFRGVEFGNWVAQGKSAKERQGMLNQAYDALMDLADIVGIPPKAISLNGTLGLGFGSRGHGWASAHFESGNLVINLTKTRGAGSLAHEWLHALDNYFQRARGDRNNKYGSFITFDPENYYVGPNGFKLPERAYKVMIKGERHPDFGTLATRYRDPAQWKLIEGVRPEVGIAFADLVKALNDSPMAKRSSLIDKGKSGGYWSRIIERAARSFENYVIAKMAQAGYHNDYLANVTAVEDFARDKGRYPYLLPEEVAPVAEAFDNLFNTLETKETDQGIALMEESAVYTVNEPDAFTGDIFQGAERALPETERRAVPAGRQGADQPDDGQGGSRILAVREAADTPGVYHVSAQLVTVGERQLPVASVNTSEDAARAFAHLSRYAVEHMDGLVTDKDGKPLAVIGSFKGEQRQAAVYPSTVLMELARIDGAANLWMSHNHPSGLANLSKADRELSRTFREILRDTSVTYRGLSAVARRGNTVRWEDDDYNNGEFAANEPAPHRVPIVERELVNSNPVDKVSSPELAKRIVPELAKDSPGVVFLTAQNEIASFVPFAPEEMGELRSGGRLMKLFNAAAKSGATGALVAMPDGKVTSDQFANLKGALGTISVGVFDGIRYDSAAQGGGKSLAESGEDVASVGASFMSRGSGSGIALRDLQAVADRIAKGLKNLPRVHVLESPAALSVKDPNQKALRDFIRKSGAWEDVEGATHNGEIYLFASGLADEARAEHVLATHEVTHYGLRGAIGKDLDAALQTVWMNNTAVRKAAAALKARNGLKSNIEATEEVLADLRPQDMVKLSGWRRVVKAARDWLQRIGATKTAARVDAWLKAGLDEQQQADLFVADLVTAARAWVKNGKGRPTMYGTLLADGSLADDVAAQEKWLTAEARARGYKSIDDLAEKNYKAFENLAKLWREKHPVSGALMSREKQGNVRNMADKDTVARTQAPISAGEGSNGVAIQPKDIWRRLVDAEDRNGKKGVLQEAKLIIGINPDYAAKVMEEAKNLGYDIASDGGLDLALIKVSNSPDNNLSIDSGSLKQNQGSGFSVIPSNGSNSPASNRNSGSVQIPRSKQIDGDSVTAMANGHIDVQNKLNSSIPLPVVLKKLGSAGMSKLAASTDMMGYSLTRDEAREAYSATIAYLKNSGIQEIDFYHVTDANLDDLKDDGVRGSSVDYVGRSDGNLRTSSVYGYLDPRDIEKSSDGILGSTKEIPNVVHVKIPVDEIIGLIWDSNFNISYGTYSAVRLEGNVNPEWIQSVQPYSHPNEQTASAGSDADIRFSRASSQTANQPNQPPGNWQSAKQKFANLTSPDSINTLVYNFQNKFIDLKNVRDRIKQIGGTLTDLNDAYLGEEMYHGKVMKKTGDFLEMEIRPLLQQLLNNGIKKEDFESFLHARHAPEANRVLAERNPTQAMIDAGKQAAETGLKALQVQLQKAQAQGTATKAVEQAIEKAQAEKSKWSGAQSFQGTEAERLSLSGMSDAEAAQVMASIPAGKRKDMNAAAAKVDAIQAKTLAELEKYGLMDKASLDAWRKEYQFYIPLHRDEAHPDSTSHPIGQGFSIKGDAAKRRTGSNEKVTNILGHIAMQREAAITRGEKNSVSKRLYLQAAQNPDKDFWSVDRPPMLKTIDPRTGFVRSQVDPMYKNKPNVLMLRIAGRDAAIVFNEHNPEAVRLAGALKNLDGQDLDIVERTIGRATRWFAAVNTQYNPIFGIINLLRDSQSGLLNLTSTALGDKKGAVAKGIPAALKAIYQAERGMTPSNTGMAALWSEFQKVGGQTGYRDLFASPEDRGKALEKELKALERGPLAQRLHAVADWLSDYNTAMENSVRLSAYKVALDQGMSKERAASLAKNLTVNFNRKGAKAAKLGAFYAFFNASVQGTARLGKTMAGPAGRKILMGGIALGVLQQVLGAMMMGGGDDDEWDKIPDFVKERSLIFPAGGGYFVSIPMPLGFNVLPNIGRLFAEWAMGGKEKPTGAQLGKLMNVVLGSFNPVGGNDLVDTLSPTVSDPVVSLLRNKDWTGKPIYREDMASLDPTPGFTRTKDSATPWAKGMSYVVNMATGGTDYTPGRWSPTPDQIDYVIGQLTGGVGREVGKAAQTGAALSGLSNDELPIHKVPLAGRLIGSTAGTSGQSGRFYENIRELNGVEREIKGRIADGGDVAGYVDSEPLAGIVGYGNRAESQVKKLREQRRILSNAGDSAGAKEIDERISGVMKGLNTEIRSANR